MRVSAFYKLNQTQPYLDFVDVRLDTDIKAFVDPTAIRTMKSPWGSQCISLLQNFFGVVLRNIQAGRLEDAQGLLASLSERNEFHLGFSKGKSSGHAIGPKYAKLLANSLKKSKAAKTAVLEDLEDTCLMIEGVGPDLISDAICNILRGPLVEYTQDMARFYGIPLEPQVDSGLMWDVHEERWTQMFVELPVAGKFGPLILVPKAIVRHKFSFDAQKYYRHYLLPIMQQEHLDANTGLVRILKNKERRVDKKVLINRYGHSKDVIAEQTAERMQALHKYKEDRRQATRALTDGELAAMSGARRPDWRALEAELAEIPPGAKSASEYHNFIKRLLTALCFPHLVYPIKEAELHEGRKRVDIKFSNESKSGFFDWVGNHYVAPYIWVECKNYTDDIANPEVDQLAGRFSPRRGKVGLLVHRAISNKQQLLKRCKDTAADDRGFIIALDDDDIRALIEERRQEEEDCKFSLLRQRFDDLVN
jgi:hypothetical protein